MKKSILALCALFIFAGCSVSPNQDSSSSALSALNEAMEKAGMSSKADIYKNTILENVSGENATVTKICYIAIEDAKFAYSFEEYIDGSYNDKEYNNEKTWEILMIGTVNYDTKKVAITQTKDSSATEEGEWRDYSIEQSFTLVGDTFEFGDQKYTKQ